MINTIDSAALPLPVREKMHSVWVAIFMAVVTYCLGIAIYAANQIVLKSMVEPESRANTRMLHRTT